MSRKNPTGVSGQPFTISLSDAAKADLATLADRAATTAASLAAATVAHFIAREAAIVEAMGRGLADSRGSRVTPRPDVARAAGVVPSAQAVTPADRAVVWTQTGRDGYLASLRVLIVIDPAAAAFVAAAIDRVAEQLGIRATGTPGRLPFTYEKAVPGLPYILTYEIVTWQKAGEVIALLHLIDDTAERVAEAPI